MDTVPTGAMRLLAFIYETETGKPRPDCYEVIFGNRQTKLAKPITHMNLDDIQKSQKYWASSKWAARFGSKAFSSATGAPQLTRATLAGLMKQLQLSGAEVFTPDMQDRFGYELLKRRGYADYVAGKINATEFGNRLAQEWASFPVLSAIQGAHRKLRRGQSYYTGDNLNHVLTTPEKVEQVLLTVRKAPDTPSIVSTPSPSPAKPAPAPQSAPVDAAKTAGVPVPHETAERAPAPVSGGKTPILISIGLVIAWALASSWNHLVNWIEGAVSWPW